MELDGSSIDMALNTDQKNGWNIFSKSVLCDIKEFRKNPQSKPKNSQTVRYCSCEVPLFIERR